nr:YcgJ family protein [Raoultella ornithinolytica]
MVFRPHHGVLCDRIGHFCAGPAGISPWLTGRFLGAGARQMLSEMTGDGGVALSKFELSNGVWCDAGQQTCWKRGPDGRMQVSVPEMNDLWPPRSENQ